MAERGRLRERDREGKCRANKTNKNIREVASINNLSRYKQRSEIAITILHQSIKRIRTRKSKQRGKKVWSGAHTWYRKRQHTHTCSCRGTHLQCECNCWLSLPRMEHAAKRNCWTGHWQTISTACCSFISSLPTFFFSPCSSLPFTLALPLPLPCCVCFADEFTWLRARH